MPPTPTFTPRLLGETEKALNGILIRELAGTGLTERQWVILNITLASGGGGAVDRDELVARVAGVFKFGEAEADAQIAEMVAAQQLEAPGGDVAAVNVTDAIQELHARMRSTIAEITERLWGDLPADELAAAGRVLSTVLERTNAELAAAA